jgi:hypothetical protein
MISCLECKQVVKKPSNMTFEASLIYEEKSALRPPILKILKKY